MILRISILVVPKLEARQRKHGPHGPNKDIRRKYVRRYHYRLLIDKDCWCFWLSQTYLRDPEAW